MSSNDRVKVTPLSQGWEQFNVHAVRSAELSLLDALGVTIKPAVGRISYWIDHDWTWWKEVGHIVIPAPGRIELWPHPGISDDELAALRGAGAEAFLAPPSENCWVRRNGGWECAIEIPMR